MQQVNGTAMTDFLKHITSQLQQLADYPIDDSEQTIKKRHQLDHVIKLATNENPLGPSPLVIEAVSRHLSCLSDYPDDTAEQLKQALADYTQTEPQQISLGSGSSDLLEKIARVFLTTNSNLIITEHAFGLYHKLADMIGASVKRVADQNYQQDLNGILATIDSNTRLIMLANPNSPTGTWIAEKPLLNFIRQIPSDVVIVLDEAYVEYMQDANYKSAIELLDQYQNLIIMRTFSKVFALAGARFGFCISSVEIARLLKHLWKPYDVSSVAMIAALAALGDKQHLANSIACNRQGMQQLSCFFTKMKLPMLANSANFITVEFGENADMICDELVQHGILVRPLGAYHMPHHLRISIGTHDDNAIVIEKLREILARLTRKTGAKLG